MVPTGRSAEPVLRSSAAVGEPERLVPADKSSPAYEPWEGAAGWNAGGTGGRGGVEAADVCGFEDDGAGGGGTEGVVPGGSVGAGAANKPSEPLLQPCGGETEGGKKCESGLQFPLQTLQS